MPSEWRRSTFYAWLTASSIGLEAGDNGTFSPLLELDSYMCPLEREVDCARDVLRNLLGGTHLVCADDAVYAEVETRLDCVLVAAEGRVRYSGPPVKTASGVRRDKAALFQWV